MHEVCQAGNRLSWCRHEEVNSRDVQPSVESVEACPVGLSGNTGQSILRPSCRWRPSSVGRPRWGLSWNITAAMCRSRSFANDCGVSRDGSNAFYIKEAAKRLRAGDQGVPQAGRGLVRRGSRRSSSSGNGIISSSSRGLATGTRLPQRSGVRPPDGEPGGVPRWYSGIAFTFSPVRSL